MISSPTQFTQERLIRLRWLSVLAMFAAALASAPLLGSTVLWPRLLIFTAAAACFNAGLSWAVRRDLPLFSPLLLLASDIVLWGSYIYLSGGATNPLISVFLPFVAIGAIVLPRAQAWMLGLLAILAYSFLWRFYQPLSLLDVQRATYLHLLGMWLVFAVSAVVVVWFITQTTAAIRERDKALADAREQSLRNDWLISMGGLAAGAAHELSTPLGTMNMLLDDLLENADLAQDLHADLESMRHQVELCKASLGKLTRRAGPMRVGEECNVGGAAWLHGVIDSWRALNPAVNLVSWADPVLDSIDVSFDLSVERALSNLLDNACQSGTREICVSADAVPGELVVDVVDDGCGIPESALRDLAAGRPAVSRQGLGIGLLLSRAAVERLGGRLEVVRREKQGTRARITLPCAQSGEKPR